MKLPPSTGYCENVDNKKKVFFSNNNISKKRKKERKRERKEEKTPRETVDNRCMKLSTASKDSRVAKGIGKIFSLFLKHIFRI